jgi:hypothetical protein
MALSPDQWLDRLTLSVDNRSTRLYRLRSYMDGNAPLPEGADGQRDAYKDFQRKARTNFGKLIIDAVTERLIPSGFTVGDETNDNAQLLAIWKRNLLKNGIADVLLDMVGLSGGYMIVGQRPDGSALITCEHPEQVITEQDPQFPDSVRAGLKVYRDPIEESDFAFLHLPGVVHKYSRPLMNPFGAPTIITKARGEWKQIDEQATNLNFVPVFPFLNQGGLGEFEAHTDILDRINWNILQRLVITAMQAYRQRAVKGDLPSEDDEGNELNYSEIFKPGAGALWQLPDGVELWESQQTDFSAILNANKDDIRDLAAVTRTPMATLIPDGANQSAEGAAFAREGLVSKTADRQGRATAALELVMGAALAVENRLESIVTDIEIQWLPIEHRSLTERADAATKAQDLPWEMRMRDIWQYSDEEIAEARRMREDERRDPALMYPTSGERITLTGPAPADASTVAPASTSTVTTSQPSPSPSMMPMKKMA